MEITRLFNEINDVINSYLKEEERKKVYIAISEYISDKKIPKFKGMQNSVFIYLKWRIDGYFRNSCLLVNKK